MNIEQSRKPTTSGVTTRSRLANPQQQRATLAAIDKLRSAGNFAQTLAAHDWHPLRPSQLEIFQINIGKLQYDVQPLSRRCWTDSDY